jgi:CIC family chloride channel protein
MIVKEAIALFGTAEAAALALVEAGVRRHVIGPLTEAHARRRYADDLEPRRRELSGE